MMCDWNIAPCSTGISLQQFCSGISSCESVLIVVISLDSQSQIISKERRGSVATLAICVERACRSSNRGTKPRGQLGGYNRLMLNASTLSQLVWIQNSGIRWIGDCTMAKDCMRMTWALSSSYTLWSSVKCSLFTPSSLAQMTTETW